MSLRTFLREPLKAKRITRTGEAIEVTDNGRPLWVIRAADAPADPTDEARRLAEVDAEFADVLRGSRAARALSTIVTEARR